MLKVTIGKNLLFAIIFFNNGFKFEDTASNGFHDLAMLSVHISDTNISLLKMLIIVVLFITLGNLKQLIY